MCNVSSRHAQWPQPMGIHVHSSGSLPIMLHLCLYKVLHHPILILTVTGWYIWEISKNASKLAKSIGKYFGYYRNFAYFPHWVQQCTYLCCNLAKIHYFPLILAHWQFKQWHFLKLSS